MSALFRRLFFYKPFYRFHLLLCSCLLMAVVQGLTTTSTATMTSTTSTRATAEARLVARKIRDSCGSVQQALDMLQLFDNEDRQEPLHEVVASELLNLCAKHQDTTTAMKICRLVPASDICRSRCISILGQAGRHVDALNILTMLPPLSTTSPFTSAIAALGKSKEWQAVLCILQDMPTHLVTTITLNAALQSLRKAKRSVESLALLQRAAAPDSPWPKATPDRTSFHTTLSCLVEQGHVEDACALVRQMEQSSSSSSSNLLQPNDDTYSRLSSASLTPDQWRIVQALLPDKIQSRQLVAPTDFQKWTLPKRGRGKHAYWELATFVATTNSNKNNETLLVALQPNRNPAVNGMKLTFYRKLNDSGTRDSVVKLGYLLMINSKHERKSQFLGQFVDQASRGEGRAKIWIGIWLRLCVDAGLRPCTGKIRKPLLCLVLQHTFGMLPQSGGVDVVLSPSEKQGEVVLYSPSGQSLEGAVSPLDLKHQNIRLSLDPPNPPGRNIVLGCDFEAPDTHVLEASISPILQDRFSLIDQAKNQGDLSRFLLGV